MRGQGRGRYCNSPFLLLLVLLLLLLLLLLLWLKLANEAEMFRGVGRDPGMKIVGFAKTEDADTVSLTV